MRYLKSLALCFFFFGISILAYSPAVLATVTPDLIPQAPRVRDYLQDGKTQETTQPLRATSDPQANLINIAPKILNNYFFGFFGILSTIIALRAGVKVLFSNGDAKAFKDGIMTIIYAAIGVILIGSSWAIVRLILQVNLGSS